jgi:hypothetical protein
MRELESDESDGRDDVASFIAEGTYRLAAISTNDYGIELSARLAQTYLSKAICVLETNATFCRAIRNEIGALSRDAKSIANQYAQLEKFSGEYERFIRRPTRNAAEWVAKWAIRIIASGYLGTVSHQLAHKIRAFHSRASETLLAM